jgi:hypothetical protein
MAGWLDPLQTQKRPDFAEFSIALAAGFALAFTTLFFAFQLTGRLGGSRDFVGYWAAGRQLVHHANPYDHDAVSALEHTVGLDARAALVMRNPPWALPLAYPLGFFSLRVAAIPWSLLLFACLFGSVQILRRLHGSPPNRIHWLALSFTPALICLTIGQTSLILLFGLVLFLRFHKTRPFAAGAALYLCAFKPHFFLPFALVLMVWIVVSRSYRILAGGVTALTAGSLIAAWIDPAAWFQYTHYMHTSGIAHEFTADLGNLLRDFVHPDWEWLAFVPAILGCLWALGYFWPRRRHWNWLEHGSLLMLVSLLVAPFGWIFDQSLAIPALLDGAYTTRSRKLLALLALVILVMDIQNFLIPVPSPLWLWPAPVLLVWYLLATHRRQPTR